MTSDPSLSRSLGRTARLRAERARAIIQRAVIDRLAVPDEELAMAARWVWEAMQGRDARPFDLVAAMRKRRMTNVELAKRLGVGKRIIVYWRTGERTPSREMARRIADVLRYPPHQVVQSMTPPRRSAKRGVSPANHRVYDPLEPMTGLNLAAARRKVGLTQQELAALCGVDVMALQHWEQRGRGNSAALRKVQRELRERLGK